jgi:predicted phosphodiesterase
MVHIGGYPGRYDLRAQALIEACKPDIFVCGHSHILKIMYDERYEMITLNPGAAGLQGWQQLRTALRFKIEAGEVKDMEIFKLPIGRGV